MLGPLREGIMTILIVAGPIIIAAAAVGLLIGILQAATQIQDQTIPSALKLIGVMVLLIFLGVWMFSYLTRFTEKTIGKAFSMVMLNRDSIPYSEDIKSSEDGGDTIQRLPEKLLDSSTSGAPFSQYGGNSYGRLSSSQGSFNASLSPPIKAFSNAMQTNAPPTTYHYNQPEADLNSQQGYRDKNSDHNYRSNSRDYSNSRNYDDFSDSLVDDYQYQLPESRQNYRRYNQRPNQGFVPNTTIDLNNSANSSPRNIQQTPYKNLNQSSQNKVVLESSSKSKETKKEEKTTKAPEPMKIMKPKLPTYTSSAKSTKESSQNKPLPSEGINWW